MPEIIGATNPYLINVIREPKHFIGRKEEREYLKGNFCSGTQRCHVMLEAPKCYGKTSLLNIIKNDMHNSNVAVAIANLAEHKANPIQFLERLFDELLISLEEKFPGSARGLKFQGDPMGSFKELSLRFKDKIDLIVLLVDNFDLAAENADLLDYIETISNFEGYCLVLSGEKSIGQLRFNIDPKELKPFSRDEIFECLSAPLSADERDKLDPKISFDIWCITDGLPGAVKIFARYIYDSFKENGSEKIDSKLINHRIIEKAICSSEKNCLSSAKELRQNAKYFEKWRAHIISRGYDSINENLR